MDRLHDHDTVVVTLPRGQYLVPMSFSARILAVEGMTVALEVERSVETGWLGERAPNALLTFRHGNSLVGFRGALHVAQPVGDFRFVVADQVARRSRSTRINCMTPVAIRRVSGEKPGAEVRGVTVNVAPGGLLIDAAGTDAVTGDMVEFHMTHPDDRAKVISGSAAVVRHGDGLVAVAVTDESTDARAALGALVVARSRAALHRHDLPESEAPGF
ncbi:MAG TPA: PilZ domain-containing protein [Gaiellales bacterium]